MIIHVYTMCYNEEVLMPYFLRHYAGFADRIFIFDHYSDDHTVGIAKGSPNVTITPYGVPGEYSDRLLAELKNEAYKISRGEADWVMVVDIDEFLYCRGLLELLKEYKENGITLPKVTGYDMIADEVPTHTGQIYETIKSGVRDEMFSKRAVFDPAIDINYFPGAHKCNPSGNVVESKDSSIKLLHYRFLGLDFTVNRLEIRTKRLCEENVKKGWSVVRCRAGESIRETVKKSYEERKAARRLVV